MSQGYREPGQMFYLDYNRFHKHCIIQKSSRDTYTIELHWSDYVADSDPEEDPEEDPEDNQADYPADGGDGDDEPSDDDDDDTDDEDLEEEPFEEDDEEEEEEHLALTDSPTMPIVDLAGYGITDTWDEIVDKMIEIALTTLEGVNERVTELDTTVRDKPYHRRTAMLMDREAMYSRKAWAFSMDRSSPIAAHVRTLETQVAALITQTMSLQTKLTMALGHIEVLEARDSEPQEGPAEASSTWTFVYLLAIIKMAPKKRTTRATPATATTPTTNVTNAQLHALLDRGVAAALVERDVDRSWNGDNSNDSGTGERRKITTPRECSYNDFLKCQPMSFQGTEGVVESAKVERYIDGLPDMIHGSVKASKPQSMQEAIEFATKMMDKKMLTHAKRQAEHKKKFDDTSRNTQHQQQPPKRNNVAREYTAGQGDRKPYGGTKPLCSKCNYHHDGPCVPKCTNCKKIGHLARDCKSRPAANNNNNNQRAQGANARGITCFECGVQGHYKSECPKLKNGNQGNQAGNGNAVARAYAVGTIETNPNSNVVKGTFLLNNCYASVLFDTGADRSFVSTAFSSLIDIIPNTLDHGYDVELADGRII
nr:reverse transcriptase domain-containing protein [Tanacetum cinerariifolium]